MFEQTFENIDVLWKEAAWINWGQSEYA